VKEESLKRPRPNGWRLATANIEPRAAGAEEGEVPAPLEQQPDEAAQAEAAVQELETLQPPCPEPSTSAGAGHRSNPEIEVGGSAATDGGLSPSHDGQHGDGRRVRRKSQKYLDAFPVGLVKGRARSGSFKLEGGPSAGLGAEGQIKAESGVAGEGIVSADGQQAKRRRLSARCGSCTALLSNAWP